MSSRGELEIATLGRFSWMSCAPQEVKGLNDDDDDNDDECYLQAIIEYHLQKKYIE
jgi:hypothetical protein